MIICADDYGQDSRINVAILNLLDKNRLSAVSVLVNSLSKEDAQGLLHFKDRADIGLHFEISGISFSQLALKAYTGQLKIEEIFSQLSAQFDRFITLFGFSPDYIDGHQHVHQLPIVRDALMRFIFERHRPRYVRVASIPWTWPLKHISFPAGLNNYFLELPALALKSRLDKAGVGHNRFLLGYSGVGTSIPFKQIFEAYLSIHPQKNDIFHCHPSLPGNEPHREDVYEFLLCYEFKDLNRFQ